MRRSRGIRRVAHATICIDRDEGTGEKVGIANIKQGKSWRSSLSRGDLETTP